MVVPSIMLRGIIGGPAASPAAGTNIAGFCNAIDNIRTCGRLPVLSLSKEGRRPSKGTHVEFKGRTKNSLKRS